MSLVIGDGSSCIHRMPMPTIVVVYYRVLVHPNADRDADSVQIHPNPVSNTLHKLQGIVTSTYMEKYFKENLRAD